MKSPVFITLLFAVLISGCDSGEEGNILPTSSPSILKIPLDIDIVLNTVYFADSDHIVTLVKTISDNIYKIGRYTPQTGWEFAGMESEFSLAIDDPDMMIEGMENIVSPSSIAWDEDKLYIVYIYGDDQGNNLLISTPDEMQDTAVSSIGEKCKIGENITIGSRVKYQDGLLFIGYFRNYTRSEGGKPNGVMVYSMETKSIILDVSSNMAFYWTKDGIWYSIDNEIKLLRYDGSITRSGVSSPIDRAHEVYKEKPYIYGCDKLLVEGGRVFYILPVGPTVRNVKTIHLYISDSEGFEDHSFSLDGLHDNSFSYYNRVLSFDIQKSSFVMGGGKDIFRFDFSSNKPLVEDVSEDVTSHFPFGIKTQYWPIAVVEEE